MQTVKVPNNIEGAIWLLDLVKDFASERGMSVEQAAKIRQVIRAGSINNAFNVFESNFDVKLSVAGRKLKRFRGEVIPEKQEKVDTFSNPA